MRSKVKILAASLILLSPMFLGQGCSKLKSSTAGLADSQSSFSCETPQGFSGNPQTIEEAIAQINALPKPVTVACFLQSLSRPLNLNLTNGKSSAQPSFSDRSPRVFILGDVLTISVVPEGEQSALVEFGANGPVTSSVKGELAFPVQANLPPDAAYQRILYPGGTACQFCHTGEVRALDITSGQAFRSRAIRPFPETNVPLENLHTEWVQCDAVAEPNRCAILNGLFNFGEVKAKDFPPELPTLF